MATRLSGRVRRLEQTRGTCAECRGKGKVVLGYMQPELAIRTAIDDGPANSVADLDELPTRWPRSSWTSPLHTAPRRAPRRSC